jgi:hypothetical protein
MSLFIDIHGYSKLIEEQKERLADLTKIVLGTDQVRDSSDRQIVRLPTGDGMPLVLHHSAEEPGALRARNRRRIQHNCLIFSISFERSYDFFNRTIRAAGWD